MSGSSQKETDLKLLYDLNAKIQMESRKNYNNEESIRNILRQFKNKYPHIVEGLKLERNSRNIHNYSSHESPKVPEFDTEKNTISPQKQTSTSVYSNSEKECVEINTNIIATVKSSTQLLNTFDDSTNYIHTKNHTRHANNNNITGIIDANEQSHNIIVKADIHHNNLPKTSFPSQLDNNMKASFDGNSSTDSDIAEALTQIIEENSESDAGENISVDEELMRETLDEINKDLNVSVDSISDIILTPPMKFRDF